jgi:uncharacterized membrane protein
VAVRLQEIHPSIVHFPITLLPVAVGADLLGRVTGSERLKELGRTLMPIAAASAAVTAVTGLVAQEEVAVDGVAEDLLVTHRNLNLSLVTLSTALAAWRWRRDEPSTGYLALALAGLGAMSYSAYLGGKMVYEHGVGVKPAGGLRDGDSPELKPRQVGAIARRVGSDIERGVTRALDDLVHRDPLPAIGRGGVENPAALPPRAASHDGAGGTAAAGTSPDEGAGAIESMP